MRNKKITVSSKFAGSADHWYRFNQTILSLKAEARWSSGSALYGSLNLGRNQRGTNFYGVH